MNNEQLILDRLMKIQKDMGGVKEAQDNCDDRMSSLESSIEAVKDSCDNAITIQVTKNHMIFGGSLITAGLGYLGFTVIQ